MENKANFIELINVCQRFNLKVKIEIDPNELDFYTYCFGKIKWKKPCNEQFYIHEVTHIVVEITRLYKLK